MNMELDFEFFSRNGIPFIGNLLWKIISNFLKKNFFKFKNKMATLAIYFIGFFSIDNQNNEMVRIKMYFVQI